MARPTIKELYGVDAKEFRDPGVERFFKRRIELLKEKKANLAEALRVADDYEEISALNEVFKYADKSLKGNIQDYEEIFG